MSNFDILKNILDAKQDTSTKAYDTTATVRRIEGSTAWVHIPGGVDETPVRLTINAKAGDTVQLRVGGGSAWLVGNATAPPTDDTTANVAQNTAVNAQIAANTAIQDAERAKEAADSAQASADSAAASAASAQVSANNANEYASRALSGLSTVQSVAETLTWITQHGTMTLTTDTEIDPTHVYFVQDAQGDYVVGSTHYSIVTEPSADDLSTYYVLSIDESLQNYVGTHLAVTSEGLWVLPAATGYKVLIATGQGTQYTTAGTYIIDASGNTVAMFGQTVQIGTSSTGYTAIDSNGMRVYRGASQLANIGYGESNAYSGGTVIAPYYSLGDRSLAAPLYSASETYLIGDKVRYSGETYVCIRKKTTEEAWDHSHWLKVENVKIGAYSTAEGYSTAALRHSDHAEGRGTFAQGSYAHAEGLYTVAGTEKTRTALAAHAEGMHTAALDTADHAEGRETIASGGSSHAQNRGTIAAGVCQTALGRYNIEDTNNEYAAIIGNGSADDARSNALTVDWDGNVQAAGQVKSTTETYSLTLPSAVYFGGGLVRNGGVAMLSIINISKLPAGNTTLCTLPEGWRPPISVMRKFEAPGSSAGPVRLFINSSGVVSLYNYGAAITAASNLSDTITYVLA